MLDRRPRHASRGQALPFVALALVSLLALSALVVDAGYWGYEQRMEQAAADSGAIAGANELPYATASASPNPIAVLAKGDSSKNGFTDGLGGTTVVVNHPPLTGNYAGNANAVEVIVSKPQTSSFSKMFNALHATNVSGRSVALRGTAVRNCLYGLGTSGSALNFNNAIVNMPQCGIISNSGILANGSTITATSIGYSSGQMNNGNTFPLAQPLPASPASDPCPTLPGCAYLTAHPPTTLPCLMDPYGGYQNYNYSTNITLQAGRYCGQVNVNGSGSVTFANNGLFELDNGMNVNNASSISGTGVTIYNNGGSITLDGNPSVNLSAASSGNYEGILIFQPSSNANGMTVNSGPSGPLGAYAGALYFPTATVILNSGTLSTWTMVVAKAVVLNSGAAINVPSAGFPGAPVKPAALVE